MPNWNQFVAAHPDLAAEGRSLFYEHGLGLGFLATARVDGGPRVHPICPVLTEEGLYGFIVPGPKLQDLRRDHRYALHSETCPPPRQDDAFYITGHATELEQPELRATVTKQFLVERQLDTPWPGFETQAFFEFTVEHCLLTLTSARNGLPAGHTTWHS